jgi:hypothetical protein
LQWAIIIGLALWFLFGTPVRTIANWFWPDSAAPWEEVDAFYYPNRYDLTEHQQVLAVGSVDNCRTVVYAIAAGRDDPRLERGDHECGVGDAGDLGGIRVYRLTVR